MAEKTYISQVTVHIKEIDHFDELMVLDLAMPYATIHTIKGKTMIDMHIKKEEAQVLYEALKDKLENQVVSPSVDR